MNTQNKQQGFTAADMADQYATAFERGRESVLAELHAAAPVVDARLANWIIAAVGDIPYSTMTSEQVIAALEENRRVYEGNEGCGTHYRASTPAASGIDLDAVERLRNLAVYAGTAGCPSMGGDIKALLDALDANPKGGSEARALLGALVSLVAVARRYLPDYDEHPEVQKADDAIDAAMQAQANSHGAGVSDV